MARYRNRTRSLGEPRRKRGRTIPARFSQVHASFGAYLDYVTAVGDSEAAPQHSSQQQGQRDWFGTGSFEEAITYARVGWPEGRKALETALAVDVPATRLETEARYGFDVAGAYPIAARAAAGEPLAMVTPYRVLSDTKRVVDVWLNTGASSAASGAALIRRGAIVLRAIDALEAMEIRCEVRAISCVDDHSGHLGTIEVLLKRSEEALDLDRMAFCMVNPAYHRRLTFKARENDYRFHKAVGSSYGMSQQVPVPEGTLYVPAIYTGSSEEADRQVTQIVKNFMATLNGEEG